MAEIALALAVTSALTQYQAGREAKKGYESRAKFKALEGRVEGVKAKEQGIQALKNTQELLASVSASAYSGGLEPNISGGSIENFVTKNILQPGYGDFATARDNQIFIRMQTNAQVEDLLRAGREAKAQGVANALGTLGQGIANYEATRTPSTAPTTKTITRTSGDFTRSTVPSARYGKVADSGTRFRSYGD